MQTTAAPPPADPLLGNSISGLLDCALDLTTQPVDISVIPENWEPPTPAHIAVLLPQYQIELLIGRGGMGAVYKGRQITLQRPVAIKVLPAELARNTEFVARFHREAQLLASLSHQGIVTIFDFGQTTEGHLYFVMEFVDGTDLYRLIHKSPQPLDAKQALSLTMQICEAMQYAHDMGVVHRDIKPANVLVTRDGRAKLADFGLAMKPADPDAVPEPPKPGVYFDPQHSPNAADMRFTAPGAAMGTPDYAAPEVYEGKADERSDIYALGIMLYEMLTGAPPKGYFQLPSTTAKVDHRVDEVVVKALEIDPAARYQKASEMGIAVEAATKPLPKQAPPPPKRTQVPPPPARSQTLVRPPAKPPQRRAGGWFSKAMIALVAFGGIVFAYLAGWHRSNTASSSSFSSLAKQADTNRLNPTPTLVSGDPQKGQKTASVVSMTEWFAKAKMTGGRLCIEGTCKGVALAIPEITDATEVYAKRDVGCLARRANGDVVWSVVQGIRTTTGTMAGVRSISMDDEVIVIGNDGKAWRLDSAGLAPFYPSSANDSYDTSKVWSGASLYWGHFLFGEHHKLVHEFDIKSKEQRKNTPLPEDFFANAVQTFSVGWVAVGLFPDGKPKGWSLHPADGTEIRFPDSLRGYVQADGICPRVSLLRRADGQIAACDCNPTSASPLPISLPPTNLKPAIRVRGGCEFNNMKVTSLLCSAQMNDGTWRAWGDQGALRSRVETIGPAIDMDATAADPKHGFLVWIEPTTNIPGNLIASAVPTPNPIAEAPIFQGHQYQFIPERLSWVEAKAKAEHLGGHLATIGSEPEHKFICGLIQRNVVGTYAFAWLGGIRRERHAHWEWVTGEPFDFVKWHPGEPNSRANVAYLALWRAKVASDVLEWNDTPMVNDECTVGFVVEWDDVATRVSPGTATKTTFPFFGTVSMVTSHELWIKSTDGNPDRLYAITNSTSFNRADKSASIGDVKVGQQVAGIAVDDGAKHYTATKIDVGVAQTPPKPDATTSSSKRPVPFYGTVVSVTPDQLTLHVSAGKSDQLLIINSGTRITNEETIAKPSDLVVGRQVGGTAERLPTGEVAAVLINVGVKQRSSPGSTSPQTATSTVNVGMSPKDATRAKPFINSLGMKFVPVPGTKVLMCIHETRRKDYSAMNAADSEWKRLDVDGVEPEVNDDYPVIYVSYDDATEFCAWLSRKDGLTYRLPTDLEWSFAIGIGLKESASRDSSPQLLDRQNHGVFPWGTQWPPPNGAGNFCDKHYKIPPSDDQKQIPGYDDGFESVAPVMNFAADRNGIFDLSGNVGEWVDAFWDEGHKRRVYRGSAFCDSKPEQLCSSYRGVAENVRRSWIGFRVVLDLAKPATETTAASSAKPIPEQQAPAAPSQPKLPAELSTLDTQFQKLLAERVTTPFDSGVATLNAGYIASLDRERAKAQQAGQLDAILVIDAEKKLIADKQPVPETDDVKTPSSIKGLRTTYRTAYAKLETTRASSLKTLAMPLDARLATLEADLTGKGRSDDATTVHEYRDDLRERCPELLAGTTSAFTAAAVGSNPTKPSLVGKDKLINTLGMRFIRVTATKAMFCLHETRRQDYAAYAKEVSGVDESWKSQTFSGQSVGAGDDHPVVAVNYDDASAFCEWLSKKEGLTYRLPTDKEWSYAVGIGLTERRTKTSTPENLSGVVADKYPWGKWPPHNGTANYASGSGGKRLDGLNPIFAYGSDYIDLSFTTTPVMSFKPNKYTLYDMGGNVWEWVSDWFNAQQTERVLRGGSWFDSAQSTLLSSYRLNYDPTTRSNTVGFRCVVEITND